MTQVLAAGAVLWTAMGMPALAQQRPLVTEDPLTIGAGRILVEAGFDYQRDALFPASGLRGNLIRVPVAGLSFGLGSMAELQIDSGFNRLTIRERVGGPLEDMVTAEGPTTSVVEDVVVATKIRLGSADAEGLSYGLRFATRLPNASNESGLGLDTTDFYTSLLVGKTSQTIRVVGNVGFAILGDPTRGDNQNDVLTYGVSLAKALTSRAEVVGELNGRMSTAEGDPPAGTESRSGMRFGARYTLGPARLDAAVTIGLTDRDPGFGFTVGYTHVFNAFAPN
jgi:hypothetical protein